MFKHLLLPTDGSKLSDEAVTRGIAFAKETGAKVCFLHVLPEYVVDAFASDSVSIRHGQPWKAIIDVAGGRACDLIFMASHGRRGISALVLGSETHKVLTHSSIPVLVFR